MREREPWRLCSDVEFENATEAMEKLVMNRLYELFVFFSFSMQA
jgi:Rab5 GDP/GTP exchange factor